MYRDNKRILRLSFFDGHPQKYHIAAVVLAIVAMSIAITTKIFAQSSGGSGTESSSTAPYCSYTFSDWGACQPNGEKTRTITGKSPSGCVDATVAPVLVEHCTYTAPACVYSYSSWGACQSTGKQTRTVIGASPSGCTTTTAPVLIQSCSYVSTDSTSASLPIECSYTYGSWGACQSNGTQTRSVSKSPSGCVEATTPSTVQSCVYVATSSTSADSAGAIQCVYSYSSWGTCQENGKRFRTLSSKSPTGCQEYTSPVLEQSCVYDAVATTTTTTTTKNTTTVVGSGGSMTDAIVTTETTTGITPAFSFANIVDGITITQTFEIKGEVGGAQGVEYYLVPTGSNTYKYIGTATKISDSGWSLRFDSSAFPNGEFYMRAKIKNAYGEYGSGQRKILIANGNQSESVAASGGGFIAIGMSTTEKAQILNQFAENIQFPVESVESGVENVDQQKKQILDYCQETPEKCFPDRDSDSDGLSDVDEIRYGTNPRGADTDLDGFIDGDEIKNGFDPLKYSGGDQSDKMIFESPKDAGEVKKDVYVVKNVEIKNQDGSKKLQLTGKGLPNSFVTIYVYSNDPIVLTVKTDNEGNWTYELDKELENGEHQVYVAVTDNTGKITAKSEPLAFVKTAEAATIIPSADASQQTTPSVAKERSQRDLFFLVAIVIAALAVALAAIGLIKHKHSAISASDSLS